MYTQLGPPSLQTEAINFSVQSTWVHTNGTTTNDSRYPPWHVTYLPNHPLCTQLSGDHDHTIPHQPNAPQGAHATDHTKKNRTRAHSKS